jgi:uncharacterized protein YkwD
VLFVLAFALVCAVPLGVTALTGVMSGADLVTDETETADAPQELAGSDRDASDDDGGAAGTTTTTSHGSTGSGGGVGAGAGVESSPPGTGTADIPPSSAATAPPTTSAPPATAAPATAPPARPAPRSAPPRLTPVEQVLVLVNLARAQGPGHCGPITLESHLTAAAQGHSDDMAARNYFSHDTPEGLNFAARITNAGYPGFPAAENIARGQRSAQQVMTDWMNSPGHRTNIENCEHTAIGIGLNTTARTWTQDFGF